jgi:tetratricopeptide (TPR) repeat protein
MIPRLRTLGIALPAAIALVAIAAWPFFVTRGVDEAQASALPTMAPVVADYNRRDWEIHVWENSVAQHLRNNTISPSRLAAEYLQRYRERGDIEDVLRAEGAAKLALRVQPHYIPAVMELSATYLTLHRFYDALGELALAEQVAPGDPSIELQEASLDLEVGRYSRAQRLIEKDAFGKSESIAADTIRSRYLEETGHLEEARALLHRAASIENSDFDAPAQARAWFFMREGEMAFEAGDNDAALANEREALVVFPHYADAGRMLARFECALHDWNACLADATRSANLVPYPETLGYEADAQRALGDAAGAAQTEDLIVTVERIGNTQHISDRLLAVYYSDHGVRADDAYRIARNELLARDDIYTEDTLAWAAAMDGRWDVARSAIRKALVFDTQDARLQYHAGAIALHFGDRTEAKRRFARALALNPHFHPAYADDARSQLARL